MTEKDLTENLDGYVNYRLGSLKMPVGEAALGRVKAVALDLEVSAKFVRKDLPFDLEPLAGARTGLERARLEKK